MKPAVLCCLLAVLGLMIVGCYGESSSTSEEPAPTASMDEPLPDPGPEEAQEVENFVRQWVAQHADGDVYDIPPRGDNDVTGSLAAFHTVRRQDADTYAMCVDFTSGEDTYDVDFFVTRADDGLSLADHYLHMINGEALE